MVLVERLWKSTSWKKWRLDEEKDAYLCRALGILNVAAARELLEEKLQDEMVLTKREAAKALGYIADVRSVRPLFALMEREPESDDSAFGAAAMAISRCADRETIPFLKEKASKSKSKIVKVMIKTIVSGLEKASE
jgi:HEAT repeat protein